MRSKSENKRVFTLPETYEKALDQELEKLGYPLRQPKRLAEAVLQLSDYYVQNPDASTPWEKSWAKAASLAYYFPLNYARNQAVAQEAARLGFFDGLKNLIDFGSGTASGIAAFLDTCEGHHTFETATAYDVAQPALDLGLKLQSEISARSYKHSTEPVRGRFKEKTLLIASYVVTELQEWPEWFFDAEAIAIVEPSTQQDARKLMAARDVLKERGFDLWAPCTHMGDCPLFVGSARDWCHDRIHWRAPLWFEKMESFLPMKNKTLTYSYLLARKSQSPLAAKTNLARLTGDSLIEKGKIRQSLCRGPEREFLTWFPQRMKERLDLYRGNLLEIVNEPEKKSNELRIKEAHDVIEISPDERFSPL